MKRSGIRNKAQPKPTTPRNPSREKAVQPIPKSPPVNPIRETKIVGGYGPRIEIMHGALAPGFSIVSKPDGDCIAWDGVGDGKPGHVSHCSVRITYGPQRGRKA